jgi:hypothetical protein
VLAEKFKNVNLGILISTREIPIFPILPNTLSDITDRFERRFPLLEVFKNTLYLRFQICLF